MTKITIEQVRSRATETSFLRGQEYYESDAIFDAVRRGNLLEGFCEGSQVEPYHITVQLDKNGVEWAECSCPYEYGGDCKHVVALLLTYIGDPEAFAVRPPVQDMLAERSKEDLIALIQQIVERYPEAKTLVERPQPSRQARKSPINTDAFRKELRRGLREYSGWGDTSAVSAVYSVAKAARGFEQTGDWHNASQIYCVIVQECLVDDEEYMQHDEEGDLSSALNMVVESLTRCLPHIADDDAQRMFVFKNMINTSIHDIDMGGYGLGEDVFETVLRFAKREDLPTIRAQIEPALERKRSSQYGQWGVEKYAEFLSQLDALDNVDPEVALKRLRDEGLYSVLFEKLLALQRIDEAVKVIKDDFRAGHEYLRALPKLIEAGHENIALQLAHERLQQTYDAQLINWLLAHYEAKHDMEACFKLQLKRMNAEPNLQHYKGLKAAAKEVGKWEKLRPAIIQRLEQANEPETLIRVYLHDEEWDIAWAALENMPKPKSFWDYRYRNLDLEVAEISRQARPQKALPIFIKYARNEIEQRSRDHYRQAAVYIATVRDLYRQIGDMNAWKNLIDGIRADFRKLPALQDELNQARL